jgi:hypothetical protein
VHAGAQAEVARRGEQELAQLLGALLVAPVAHPHQVALALAFGSGRKTRSSAASCHVHARAAHPSRRYTCRTASPNASTPSYADRS